MHSRLRETLDWLSRASAEQLGDKAELADHIGRAGLFDDGRRAPQDPSQSLYGADARYALPTRDNSMGLWQTPLQLAGFLIAVRDKGIRTYLDVGTFNGWTIAIVAAYLKRFGLQRVDSVDVFALCTQATRDLWREYDLPITYVLCPAHEILERVGAAYDFAFIDANHEYESVKRDFFAYAPLARMVGFHDIHDHHCPGVVRWWKELRAMHPECVFNEFTEHPNGWDLMGIGVVERAG